MPSHEEELEIMEERAHRVDTVSVVCSGCGKLLPYCAHKTVPGGYVYGIIDKYDNAHAFCSKDCLIRWFEANGFGPIEFQCEVHRPGVDNVQLSDAERSMVLNDELPWPGDVPCPICGSKKHDSEYIAYGHGYNERAYHCKNCGWNFTCLTK